MRFQIAPGVPDMKALIDRLRNGLETGTLDKDDRRLAKKLSKTIADLARTPFYLSLQSHEIEALTVRYGAKVYQSYLENHTPSAGRLVWVYGPQRGMITLVGLEPHPEDQKNGADNRVVLSRMPTAEELAAEAESETG